MPELPDLTVFSENLTKRLKGKCVKQLEFYAGERIKISAAELEKAICGSIIENVKRAGKETELVFSNGTKLRVHLMLTGRFAIVKNYGALDWKVITLLFEDGTALVVSDPKGFATIKLNPEENLVPDALDITKSYLKEKLLKKKNSGIKVFLTDQKVVLGIGNAYVDEILWHSRISPKSLAGKIPDSAIDDLIAAIKKVLLDAIEQIKKADPEIIAGELRNFLVVHNSSLKFSPTGHKIIREQIASKTTYYTDEQVLYE